MRFKTKFLKSDYKKRLLIKKGENRIIIQSSLFKNKILPLSVREHIFLTQLSSTFSQGPIKGNLEREGKNIKRTQIRNRCILTGRQRGILSDYGISRLVFRKEAEKGNIPGITSHE